MLLRSSNKARKDAAEWLEAHLDDNAPLPPLPATPQTPSASSSNNNQDRVIEAEAAAADTDIVAGPAEVILPAPAQRGQIKELKEQVDRQGGQIKELKEAISKLKEEEEVEAVKGELLKGVLEKIDEEVEGHFKDKVILPKSDWKLLMCAAAGSPQAVAMVRGKVGMWNNEIDEGNAVTDLKRHLHTWASEELTGARRDESQFERARREDAQFEREMLL